MGHHERQWHVPVFHYRGGDMGDDDYEDDEEEDDEDTHRSIKSL